MFYLRRIPLVTGILIPLLFSSCESQSKRNSRDTGVPDQTAGGFLVEFDTSLSYSSITSLTDSLRDSNSCDSAYVESIGWNQSSSTLPLFLYRTYYLSFGDCMRQKGKLIDILSSLRTNSDVVNVEVDAVVKASAASIQNQAYQLAEIKRNEACSAIDSDADPVVVAVIDTGVDKNHPDLSGAFYRDASGKVIGANFLGKGTKGAPDDNWQDQNGHGTHVSGIIAGTGSTDPGVASCANVRVMPIKALGAKGTGVSIEINRAIQWAGENGADIINLSLGHLNSVSNVPEKFESSLYSYLKDKGVLVFAAAGNDGIENGSTLKSGKFVYSFPASYDSVISVAATGKDGKLASFSNYGKMIDIAAPGEKIVATKLGGGYKSMSGTSMATPVAAASYGLALLNLKSKLRQKPISYKVGFNRAMPLLKASISSRSLEASQVSSRGILSVTNLLSSMNSLARNSAPQGALSQMKINGGDSADLSSSTTLLGVSGLPQGAKQVYFYWKQSSEAISIVEVPNSSSSAFSIGQFALFGSGTLMAVAVDGQGSVLSRAQKQLQGM